MKKNILLFIVLFLGFCNNTLYAQLARLYTTESELSSSLITQICQDHEGMIWIATENGLNKFDGNKMTSYFHHRGDAHSLSNNFVNALFVDSQGHLFVGTHAGVQMYLPQTNNFTPTTINKETGKPFDQNVTAIVELPDGKLLASGYQIVQLHIEGDQLYETIYQNLENIKGIGRMRSACDGTIWFTQRYKGINHFNPTNKNNVQTYFCENNSSIVSTNLCCNGQGTAFFGTQQHGLYTFNTKAQQVICLTPNFTHPIYTIYPNNDEEIYIGTDGFGLKCYNTRTQKISSISLEYPFLNPAKLKIHAIFRDKNGSLWLGIYQKGVLMVPRQEQKFNYIGSKSYEKNLIGNNAISALAQDEQGNYWIGTDNDGIYQLNNKRRTVNHLVPGNNSNVPNIIPSLYRSSTNQIWYGSLGQGMGWKDPRTSQCQPLRSTQYPDLHYLDVYDFAEDRHQKLWIGTLGKGLFCYNLKTGDLQHDSLVSQQTNVWINCLHYASATDTLYIGTYNGAYAVHALTQKITVIFLQSIVNAMTTDHKGDLWMGTNDGLFRRAQGQTKLDTITINDAPNGMIIYSIHEDNNNQLWMGTNQGLICLNTLTLKADYYYAADGLQGNEFCRNSSLIDQQKQLWFGGINGITYFNPDNIMHSRKDFNIALSNFYIYNQSISSHDYRIKHKENNFTFELTALDFAIPRKHITYQYSLNGNRWISMMKGVYKISFNNLPAQRYHLRIRAQYYDVESNELNFNIIVLPPWWRSWWAWTIYILIGFIVVGIILWLGYKRYQSKLEIKRYIQEEKEKEAKLQFLINISHEIRTPMSLIISPLQKLIENDEDTSLRKRNYSLMYRNAHRILNLVNQLLDVRKIEKGQMHLLFKQTEMVAFIEDVCENFIQLSTRKNIKLRFVHSDIEQLKLWIDPSNFDKIIFNLLSNAFKFTPEGGEVVIELTQTTQSAQIVVRDTGKGLIEADKEKIFDRFFQSKQDSNGAAIGTGIGLNLTRSLVELHHGTIQADNNGEHQPGCHFTITLPLESSHLAEEDMITEKRPENVESEVISDQTNERLASTSETCYSNEAKEVVRIKSKTKYHVLIVEDDEEINEYLCRELAEDFHLTSCGNGKEAIELLHKQSFNLVVSDIMMPEMDGISLCKHIKQHLQFNHIPIILLTAKTRETDNITGLAVGADAYITKPFSLNILRSTILSLIQNRLALKNSFSGTQEIGNKVESPTLQSPDEKLMERIIKVVNDNLSNTEISVKQIADEIGISTVHLNRKLKELTNQTSSRFIRNIRLQAAARLLAEKKHSIAEVSDLTGFSDPNYFSKSFKELYGMYPTAYMKENNPTETD